MKFAIQPVHDESLGDVARFLHRWHEKNENPASPRAVPKSSTSIERCLRWLFIENPAQKAIPQFGFCARDDSGAIRGLTLNFANSFVAADKRVTGLCSGSYFVEQDVRTAGFFLFKRYLDSPGCDFYFATTCNANSGAIWTKVGGGAAPNSEREYILPLKFDVMLPAFLGRRSTNPFAGPMARALGGSADFVTRLLPRRSTPVITEPNRDWDKLSALSRRHTPPDLMTAERSTSFLQWRYGPGSPNHSADICVVRDSGGREGWFALGERMLGRDGSVRAAIVLDAMWPRSSMHFGDIVPAIVQRASAWADAIFFPPRPGISYSECSRFIVSRTLEAPRVWVLPSKGRPALDLSRLDLATADGDSAWSNRFENEVAPTGI